MLILLPPSERKAAVTSRAGARRLDVASLALPELTDTRHRVMDALMRTSACPNALDLLAVPAGAAADVADNLSLPHAPTLTAARLYTGVLYDALDLGGLDASSRRRASSRLLIASALWGFSRIGDRLPRYRLGMAARLVGLGTVASVWRDPLAELMPTLAGRGLLVDCRSSGYAAAWPGTDRTVKVTVQRETAGRRQVVSHMAKHTRGLLARTLCQEPSRPRTACELAEVAAARLPAYAPEASVELDGRQLTLVLRQD